MPVTRLVVEGDDDYLLLRALCDGRPEVDLPAGGKRLLGPRTLAERTATKSNTVFCIRDRDFDFDPEAAASAPAPWSYQGQHVGWHWQRHELENYLLEPALVCRAKGWDRPAIEGALVAAAKSIRFYTAARWTVGVSRRALPPNYELRTGAVEEELCLPDDLSHTASAAWAESEASRFLSRAGDVLQSGAVRQLFDQHVGHLTETFLSDAPNILLWCAGKDLLAALPPWLGPPGVRSAGQLRGELVIWAREHPKEVLDALPEWRAFLNLLRSP